MDIIKNISEKNLIDAEKSIHSSLYEKVNVRLEEEKLVICEKISENMKSKLNEK